MSEVASRPTSKLPVLLRTALFLVFGYLVLILLASMMYEALGLLIASVLGVFAAASLATTLVIRIFERGRLADIGLRWTPGSFRNLLSGCAGGFGAVAAILVPALIAGAAWWKPAPEGAQGPGGFVFLTLILLFGAAGEEMLFRGYGFQILVPVFGPVASLLPMSILFGLVHMGNSNVNATGAVNTVAWAILLGAALLRSGDLWFPIGLHFGWNWGLALFGANVSGFTMRLAGHSIEWSIAPLWTGGAYGPEGGLMCTAVVILLGFFVMRAPVARQQLALIQPRCEEAASS